MSDKRLEAGDEPLLETVDSVSFNEAHGFLEGVATGYLAGRTGCDGLAVATTIVALGWPARGPIGLRTLRREPWYALVGLVVGYVLGQTVSAAS